MGGLHLLGIDVSMTLWTIGQLLLPVRICITGGPSQCTISITGDADTDLFLATRFYSSLETEPAIRRPSPQSRRQVPEA